MKRSVKYAILVPILIALLASITIQTILLTTQSASTTNSLSSSLIDETVASYANHFASISKTSYGTLSALQSFVKDYAGKKGQRESLISVLKDIVATNEDLFSVWTCWEPNAFDGDDENYVNAPMHDETGRFVPSVFRHSTETLRDYTDPVAGNYYFGALQSGKIHITAPYYYEIGGVSTFLYSIALPVEIDGKTVGVVGVDVDLSMANAEMNKATIIEEGYITVISPDGSFATHPNSDLIMTNYRESWLKEAAQGLDNIINNGGGYRNSIQSTETQGAMLVDAEGIKLGSYEKNWIVCGIVPNELVEEPTKRLVTIVVVMSLVLIAAISTVLIIMLRRKLKPLQELRSALDSIAEGKLGVNITHKSQDEFGSLADSMRRSALTLQSYIADIDREMEEMVDGNFDLKATQTFIGDFKGIQDSIYKMTDQMCVTLTQINTVADQVSVGSHQVSSGAQALAQGATEQASSVEELSASVSEISNQVNQTATNSNRAAEMSNNTTTAITESDEKMHRLMESMNDIDAKSKEIGKIIKTIEDIAFQTNILALNASVEAARAGTAGKGFAVVAGEVRNLSAKTSEAAKNITALIADSLHAINEGVHLAQITANDLTGVVDGAVETTKIVSEISKATSEQVQAISQVLIGLDQISAVVQMNSATGEESAASSQELSSQASLLKELIGKFKLKKMNDTIVMRDTNIY